ncbi:TIGR00266 family protein [Lutispora thermophila]|uniref:TIGR00266 family protein n=1 Tax=Lutispora thermophila DSM 19022 TaxID=1122184 RepID=A0A1M6BPP9_9FIRM|nr:TIGR00266 family protein [Lutispora thermophila]SHI50662.1 TIGR00266 family protein [Lutispora thermophila DSM 19022]
MKKAHEVDFKLYGDDMQIVEIQLDPGESVVAEAGAMMYMDDGIMMDTIFGDGSDDDSKKSFMDKMLGAGKRVLTGESLFMTMFTNRAYGKKSVAFAAPYPGKIIAKDLSEFGGNLICQRDSFLCAARGIQVEIAFQKNVGAGLFGGEGFIMQRLIGDGLAFMHAGGTIIEKELAPGEVLRLDTGCLVAMTTTIDYNVEFVGSVKSAFFGGEGLFLATLRGPGHVWLQSIPFSRLANRIVGAATKGSGSGKSKGEGSLLGNIGIGDLFGKD